MSWWKILLLYEQRAILLLYITGMSQWMLWLWYVNVCYMFTLCYINLDAYLSTFENFPGVESVRQLVSDILPIVRGRYK